MNSHPNKVAIHPTELTRYEYHFIRLLRMIVGQFSIEQARPLLLARVVPPQCLSHDCVRMAKESLSKGLMLTLVRNGGWRQSRYLQGDKPINGRIWERWPINERSFKFTVCSLKFLMSLGTDQFPESVDSSVSSWHELADGDELFLAWCMHVCSDMPDVATLMIKHPAIVQNPLAWLLAPSWLCGTGQPTPKFSVWLAHRGAMLVECLEPLLTKVWLKHELSKRHIKDWRAIRELGDCEASLWKNFLAACKAIGRLDLTRFLMRTIHSLFEESDVTIRFWTSGLSNQVPSRLADRLASQRAALATVSQVLSLQQWEKQARTVGFTDENYAISQFWKSEWDAHDGERLASRVQQLLGKLDPLKIGV